MSLTVALQIIFAALQLAALAVAYGKLRQKVDDIDGRVIRIERWIDDKRK